MEYTTTPFYLVGTCKMGPSSDPQAVVNERLKVYGVDRLRVVDSSIMPKITRGNTIWKNNSIASLKCNPFNADMYISYDAI